MGATPLPKMTEPTSEELGYADRVFVDELGDTSVVVFRMIDKVKWMTPLFDNYFFVCHADQMLRNTYMHTSYITNTHTYINNGFLTIIYLHYEEVVKGKPLFDVLSVMLCIIFALMAIKMAIMDKILQFLKIKF